MGFMEAPEEHDYGEQLYNLKDTMSSLTQASIQEAPLVHSPQSLDFTTF